MEKSVCRIINIYSTPKDQRISALQRSSALKTVEFRHLTRETPISAEAHTTRFVIESAKSTKKGFGK